MHQVQQEVLQKRKEEKKAAVEAVKKFRKGKGDKPSFLRRGGDELDDDSFPVIAEMERESGKGTTADRAGGKGSQKKGGPKEKSKKRQQKVIALHVYTLYIILIVYTVTKITQWWYITVWM